MDEPRHSTSSRFVRQVEVCAAVAGIFVLLLWLAAPNFVGGGPNTTSWIVGNLRQIDAAKQMWALDHHQSNDVAVTREDLIQVINEHFGRTGVRDFLKPVAGEQYTINTLWASPEAVLTRKVNGRPRGTVLKLGKDSAVEFILPNQRVERNGSQPIRSETNRTSSAAGSPR